VPALAEAAWVASSFILSRMPSIWLAEPSATCSRALPSTAFLDATVKDLTFTRSLLAMARPAASSAARLMRKPLDSFSMLLFRLFSVPSNCRCALIAATLVLMRSAIVESSLIFLGCSDHPWPVCSFVISFQVLIKPPVPLTSFLGFLSLQSLLSSHILFTLAFF
jgi:hypothetical protein